MSSLVTEQLEPSLNCSDHCFHDVTLASNNVVMMSAGSLVLIHVKWREEAREERPRMN